MRSSSFGSNGTSFVHIEASTQRSAIRAFEKYLWLRGTMVLYLGRAMIPRMRPFLWFYCRSESFALVSTMALAWARFHAFLFQCFFFTIVVHKICWILSLDAGDPSILSSHSVLSMFDP